MGSNPSGGTENEGFREIESLFLFLAVLKLQFSRLQLDCVENSPYPSNPPRVSLVVPVKSEKTRRTLRSQKLRGVFLGVAIIFYLRPFVPRETLQRLKKF